MKFSSFLWTSLVWAGVIGSAVYLTDALDIPTVSASKIDTQAVMTKTKEKVWWKIQPWISQSYPVYRDEHYKELNIIQQPNNVTLAFWEQKSAEINTYIQKHPEIWDSLQFESWWQDYMAGVISPDKIIPLLASFQGMYISRQNQPGVYDMVSSSPQWSPHDIISPQELILHQSSLIETIGSYHKMTETNPGIEDSMLRHNITWQDIVNNTTDSTIWNDFRAIVTIENEDAFEPEVREQFFKSEAWQKYLQGNVSPTQALEYLQQIQRANTQTE